ncbi:MAG: hypothetical protein AB1665_07960 [Candidatus Thermoplasmatota archaeon]
MSRIFKDLEKLDFNYVPQSLPHREEELQALSSLYSHALRSRYPQHSVITGKSGVGKAVLAKGSQVSTAAPFSVICSVCSAWLTIPPPASMRMG